MKIAHFQIHQQAVSEYHKTEVKSQSLAMQFEPPQTFTSDQLSLSEEGLREVSQTQGVSIEYSEEDLRKIELLEKFMEQLTGKSFKFKGLNAAKKDEKSLEGDFKTHLKARPKHHVNSPQRLSAFRLTAMHKIEETEQMQFQSKGTIRTEDGTNITFEVNLNLSRSYLSETHLQVTVGEFHDPLVLNLDGKGVAFSDQTLRIDLNLDGKIDAFRALTEGSGILVIDHNQNGRVDDGTEVIGARTNNAFAELEAFDHDGNMWIDENDPIFEDLKIWVTDAKGSSKLLALSQAAVGALYLGGVGSDYHFTDTQGAYAKIRESSIYLKETGQAMMMHEVDLKI